MFQGQYATYAELGAAGFWSIDAWMGPWPHLALRDAVKRGDLEAAKAITLDIVPPGQPPANLSWRETASKIAIRMSGYVDPGPLRPPFVEIPAEVTRAHEAARRALAASLRQIPDVWSPRSRAGNAAMRSNYARCVWLACCAAVLCRLCDGERAIGRAVLQGQVGDPRGRYCAGRRL